MCNRKTASLTIEQKELMELRIWPNPFSEQMKIEIEIPVNEPVTLSISDYYLTPDRLPGQSFFKLNSVPPQTHLAVSAFCADTVKGKAEESLFLLEQDPAVFYSPGQIDNSEIQFIMMSAGDKEITVGFKAIKYYASAFIGIFGPAVVSEHLLTQV